MLSEPTFNTGLVDGLSAALGELKESVPGLITACVATRDGFEIARLHIDNDQRKLAAMASSMHALGDALAAEATLGECLNVIIEGSTGKAVMLTVPDAGQDKVLVAAASAETNLAILLISTRNCCAKLAEISKQIG